MLLYFCGDCYLIPCLTSWLTVEHVNVHDENLPDYDLGMDLHEPCQWFSYCWGMFWLIVNAWRTVVPCLTICWWSKLCCAWLPVCDWETFVHYLLVCDLGIYEHYCLWLHDHLSFSGLVLYMSTCLWIMTVFVPDYLSMIGTL